MKNKFSKIPKPVVALAAVVMVGAGLGAAAFANADTISPTTTTSSVSTQAGMHGRQGMAPGVRGTVSAVSGNTLMITETNPKDSTTKTYTVDATNAKVMKFAAPTTTATTDTTAKPTRPTPTTISVSAIAVGDKVEVRGTVSGTNVVATDIMDGMMGGFGGGHGGPRGETGKITAVNGSTVTITDSKGNTYTIDASSSKLEKISTISVSDLAVGDTISADGPISGTTITAKNIMDGAMMGGFGGGQHGPGASATASAN